MVIVLFPRSTALFEVHGQTVDFPVAPCMEVLLVVIGPVGSVRTEYVAPVSTRKLTGLPPIFNVSLGSWGLSRMEPRPDLSILL